MRSNLLFNRVAVTCTVGLAVFTVEDMESNETGRDGLLHGNGATFI